MLKLVHLILAVAKLFEIAFQLALVLGALLASTDGLVHARWATDEDLDLVALLGLGQNRLEQFLGDVALAALPYLGWVVEDVEGAEPLRICVLQLFPLLLQQNILLREITIDERDLGLILWVFEDAARSLPHGCDTRSTRNQGDVLELVRGPWVLGDGSLDVQSLAGLHVMHVAGHGTVGVLLNNKVDGALLIDVADGCVWSDDGFLHVGALVLGDDGGYTALAQSHEDVDGRIQATGNPLSMSSSGSLKVSFLVLWLMISDFSNGSEMKPWSPPVKAGFPGVVLMAGIFFPSPPRSPEGNSPPLKYR